MVSRMIRVGFLGLILVLGLNQSGHADEKSQKKETDQKQLVEELYKTIGQQKIELEWLKKKSELFESR